MVISFPFNAELTSRKKSKTGLYDPVVTYEDFPHSESLVLEVTFEAVPTIDKHRRHILENALKRRNHYAHPSPTVANAPIAAGLIADLLEHVVLDPFFS